MRKEDKDKDKTFQKLLCSEVCQRWIKKAKRVRGGTQKDKEGIQEKGKEMKG